MIVIPTGTHTADDILKRFISEFLCFLIFHAATLLFFRILWNMNCHISLFHSTSADIMAQTVSCAKKTYRPCDLFSIMACKISTLPVI